TNPPRDSPSLVESSEKGSTNSERGHPVAPMSRPVKTAYLVPGPDAEVLGELPQGVVNTITSEVETVHQVVFLSQYPR
ncbi:hypothetical protein M9458_052477, partial [Cirrhinus mrigala]